MRTSLWRYAGVDVHGTQGGTVASGLTAQKAALPGALGFSRT